jgi:excinuclease ABC subunit C
MRDRLSRIIYVGKAKDLKRRVASYFTNSKKNIKTHALVQSIWEIQYHIVQSNAEAILLEGKLIKEHRPKYNIAFRDDKQFLHLKITLSDPFPKFELTRWRKNDGAKYYGPFPNAGSIKKTLEQLTKHYGLRSCTPKVPTELDFKHCHAHITKNCSAPCIGKISGEEYKKRVETATQVLEGKTREMIKEIEQKMKPEASQLHFEKAAELRNLMEDLKATTQPTKRYLKRPPLLQTTINPTADLKELQIQLNLPTFPQIIECFDISNISSTHIVASMVRFKHGVQDKKNYRTYRIQSVKTQDDFASIAEVVRRRYSRLLKEGAPLPNLVVVDGGRGQLSSACKELNALQIQGLPIIGLAKEFEEIHRPNNPIPIQLPHSNNALKLLQRIRDEAHRTANGYHKLLLKKRIQESELDKIPGVNKSRKNQLLKKFGSVERIRRQTVENLSSTPTVTRPLAKTILDHLNAPTPNKPPYKP